MNDNKQYPKLPEPTAWRTYDNLLKRARYNAVPITSMQPGVYSHTQMFTEYQMRAFADATCAMRANNMFLKERAKLNQEWGAINGIRAAQASPFGYVNTYTGQFFKDVEPSRKNNEGHWVTVYAEPQAAPAPQDAEDALVAALERAYFWMDSQADTQSKGCHATFDLMMLREERDAAKAAIDAARAKQEGK